MRPHRFTSIGGVRIHYTESGNPASSSAQRPTLVLVHGFAASLETWYDIVPELEKSYNVVRVDLKGFGFSDKPRDEQYHVRDQARLLAEFLVQQKLSNVVLIGHSYGGAVAILTYHLLRSQNGIPLICALVLIDSAGYPQDYPFQVEAYRSPLVRFLMSSFTSSTWRADYGLRRIFWDDSRVTPDRVRRYAYFYNLPGSHYALAQVAEEMDSRDSDLIVDELEDISVPTLIIWGTKDPVIPLTNGHQFARAIPNTRLALIPSGHVPQEERPAETLNALLPFLDSLRCEPILSS